MKFEGKNQEYLEIVQLDETNAQLRQACLRLESPAADRFLLSIIAPSRATKE